MKLFKLVASVAVLAILPSAAAAQQVNVTQGPGNCAGSPPDSYSWWFGIASGLGCGGSGSSGGASNVLEWTYLNGTMPFTGMAFTGYGTFTLELLNGDDVVYTGSFEVWGENVPVSVTDFTGSVTGVRVVRQSGIGAFGVGDDGFNDPAQNTSGNGPQGNGPDGNGPQGNGPDGNGPQGNGPDGNGPQGNGPDGNGPQGNGPGGNNGNNENNGNLGAQGGDDDDPPFGGDDDLNALVNETNAAPEPATILLVASGLGGVGAMARRRRKQNKDS